jgi:hypothetical protein
MLFAIDYEFTVGLELPISKGEFMIGHPDIVFDVPGVFQPTDKC